MLLELTVTCLIILCSLIYWLLPWWRTERLRQQIKRSLNEEYTSLVDARQVAVRDYLRAKMEDSVSELRDLEMRVLRRDKELEDLRHKFNCVKEASHKQLIDWCNNNSSSSSTAHNNKNPSTEITTAFGGKSVIIEELNNIDDRNSSSSSGESVDMDQLG